MVIAADHRAVRNAVIGRWRQLRSQHGRCGKRTYGAEQVTDLSSLLLFWRQPRRTVKPSTLLMTCGDAQIFNLALIVQGICPAVHPQAGHSQHRVRDPPVRPARQGDRAGLGGEPGHRHRHRPGPVRSQRRGPGRVPAAGRRGVPGQGRDRAGPGVLPAGPQQRRLAPAPGCATRRCVFVWRWKGSTAGPSQRSGEAGGSLIRGSPGRAGAASTTSGRAGTARRPGSG